MHDSELWQEYNQNGEPTPGVGHPKDYFHETNPKAICGTAHVWLYRETPVGRELLFQKRSAIVSYDPNQWDISASGHMNLGEKPTETAVREAKEEIGAEIDPSKLILVGSNYGLTYSAVHHIYLYKWTGPDTFRFNDKEVSEVRWVPLSEIPDFIAQNVKPILASLNWYWELLIDHHLKLL